MLVKEHYVEFTQVNFLDFKRTVVLSLYQGANIDSICLKVFIVWDLSVRGLYSYFQIE